MINNIYFNKRGSISIAVMAIGTFVIFSALMFMLAINSSKIVGDFGDVYSYGGVYAEQRALENSMYFILVEQFLNNYQKVLTENSNKIGSDNIDLNKNFSEKISKIVIAEPQDVEMKEFLLKKTPVFSFSGDSANIVVNGWNTNRNNGEKGVFFNTDYYSTISANVNFKMLELMSFDEINRTYKECSALDKQISTKIAIQQCFEQKFDRFDVVLEYDINLLGESGGTPDINIPQISNPDSAGKSENKERGIVTVTSKDKYYIDKEMKNINFVLIFDYAGKTDWSLDNL